MFRPGATHYDRGGSVLDYKNISAVEAIRHAKEASGLTAEEIAPLAGVSPDTMRQYLRRAGGYMPGLDKIPGLCRAFGNTVLLQWVEAQLERDPEEIPPAKTRAEVLTAVARTSASLGDVQRLLAESEVKGIDPACAREIRGMLRDVIQNSRFAMATLAALASKQGRADGALFSARRAGMLERIWRRITQ